LAEKISTVDLTFAWDAIKIPSHKNSFIMTSALLTSQGRITITAQVRQALKLCTDDRVEFVEVAPDRYEFFVTTLEITQLRGMFDKPANVVSLEVMNAAIAKRGATAR
jgi:antitoxin PrlF